MRNLDSAGFRLTASLGMVTIEDPSWYKFSHVAQRLKLSSSNSSFLHQ